MQAIDHVSVSIKLVSLIGFGIAAPQIIIFHGRFISSPACHYYDSSYIRVHAPVSASHYVPRTFEKMANLNIAGLSFILPESSWLIARKNNKQLFDAFPGSPELAAPLPKGGKKIIFPGKMNDHQN
ncbi:unnamed protein product [Gongylonema pulchrum]|uniref:Uncharacterized protein n=1 Tax=Gongylonema pulchrum TaxID=637853 RepID=A0A3P6NNS1_9BILA|nr:unnamed protein product [Gongylonema pulchrum]